MKKVIPFLIIVFVFGSVITTGFLILKTGLTSDTSNARLIEALIGDSSPAPTIAFTHLAGAETVIAAWPKTHEIMEDNSFAELTTSTENPSSTNQAIDVATARLINQQMAAGPLSQ